MGPTRPTAANVVFFPSPAHLRRWFEQHAETALELHVGYWKKGSGKPSVTWPESIDEALCCGWIDGVRRSLDEESYTVRFTPRKPGSIWSPVNIRRVGELTAAGRMRPAGLAAFEKRREYRSGTYSYEERSADLPEPYAGRFSRHPAAWDWFRQQPPSYRKAVIWWIVCAKKEETRLARLETLIRESAAGRRIETMKKRPASG